MRDRRRDWLGVGAIVSAYVSVALVTGGTEALAVILPSSCENAAYNVEVVQGTQAGNQKGINADVWFGNFADDCNRISSFWIPSSTGNGFVEWGWVLGYSSCNGQYYSNPRMFLWAKPNSGSESCAVVESSQQETWYDMTLRDTNQDTVWTATRGTTVTHTINVNFVRGDATTNSERDCTCDSAFGHYKALSFMVTGNTSWFNWTDPDLYWDDDPDYHWVEVSAREHKVVHD
jgi:hypothetical protein